MCGNQSDWQEVNSPYHTSPCWVIPGCCPSFFWMYSSQSTAVIFSLQSSLSISHFRSDHSSFPPVLSALFPCSAPLIFTSSSSDPVFYRHNDLRVSPGYLVSKQWPASGCNSSTIRSAAPVQLPPPLRLLPHTRLLRHTRARASRQPQGPQTLLGSHYHWLPFFVVQEEEILAENAFMWFNTFPYLASCCHPSYFRICAFPMHHPISCPHESCRWTFTPRILHVTMFLSASTLSDVKYSFQLFETKGVWAAPLHLFWCFWFVCCLSLSDFCLERTLQLRWDTV